MLRRPKSISVVLVDIQLTLITRMKRMMSLLIWHLVVNWLIRERTGWLSLI